LGLPFARLRASIPDELMATTLAHALGRKHGLSVAALDADVNEQTQLIQRLSILCRPSQRVMARIPSRLSRLTMLERIGRDSDPGGGDEAEHEAEGASQVASDREQLEALVGTALVLAFLQVAQLVPVVRLAQLVGAANAHFEGVKTPAGWSFAKTQIDFVTLLSPGVLNCRSRWLVHARFFKLMLCQNPAGFWCVSLCCALRGRLLTCALAACRDPTSSVAFALCARAREETATLDRSWKERARDFAGRLSEAFKDGDGDITETAERLMGEQGETIIHTEALLAQFPVAERDTPNDDPLACQAGAIVASMPPLLADIAASDSSINVARVWTTLCVLCMLEELPFSWIWGDGDAYPETERTVVDAAREWLEKYAEQHPSLRAALADDMVPKRAVVFTRLWMRTFEQRVRDLRASPAIVAQRNLSQAHRTATEMVRALVMRNETFSVFLSEPMDGMQRWQMAIVLISVVCSHLLVNIWMYYAKSLECCARLRLILDGGPDGGNCPPAGACRGFEGTCGDITAQFAQLPVLPDYPDGMQDWVCTVFPDDTNELDSFLVGLIALAVALPVTLFIATCFEIADDSEAPESWLKWTGWRKLVFGRHAHRRWHYTGPHGQPVRYVKWYCRSVTAPPSETFANLCRSLYAWATGTEVPWLAEAREAALEEAEAESKEEDHDDDEGSCHKGCDGASESGGSTSSSVRSARALMRWKRFAVSTGLAGVYVVWIVFAWCAPHAVCLSSKRTARSPRLALRCTCRRFIFTYGARSICMTCAGQADRNPAAPSQACWCTT
jgi:hypothetical protein